MQIKLPQGSDLSLILLKKENLLLRQANSDLLQENSALIDEKRALLEEKEIYKKILISFFGNNLQKTVLS